MRLKFAALVGLLFLVLTVVGAPNTPFRFQNAKVANVLELYRELTQLELVVASNVTNLPSVITIAPQVMMTQDAAARLIERAFLEQAGIVVTRLEGKRASITYNDALKILAPPQTPPVNQHDNKAAS